MIEIDCVVNNNVIIFIITILGTMFKKMKIKRIFKSDNYYMLELTLLLLLLRSRVVILFQ